MIAEIDQTGKLIPYQKKIHGVFNSKTGKFDLPNGEYRFPSLVNRDQNGNFLSLTQYPRVRDIKRLQAAPKKLTNNVLTKKQIINLSDNKTKTIYHYK